MNGKRGRPKANRPTMVVRIYQNDVKEINASMTNPRLNHSLQAKIHLLVITNRKQFAEILRLQNIEAENAELKRMIKERERLVS